MYIGDMQRLQAFKYRLNVPKGAARTHLSRQVGCARLVWNRGIALSVDKYPGNGVLSALLPAWKRELPFLAEADSIVLQQSLRNLDRAWKNFFEYPETYDRPVLHKRGIHDTFRIAGAAAKKLEADRVWVPKFGWLKFRASRPWVGEVKNITFSRKAGKWYISIQTSREVAEPVKRQDAWLGIDVGVAQYATLSTGEHKPSIYALAQNEKRLDKMQRKLARQHKFSNRWKKQKRRIGALQHHIAMKRQDYAHKVSSEIVTKHGRIRMEDLRLVNMMKSAKGTVEKPGKNVAAKSGLNRKLADQGLRQLRTFIEYKLGWTGGTFEAVDAKYTSQKCHVCKHVAKANRLSQAAFVCVKCGHVDHADVNAAKNIRDSAAGTVAVKATPRRRKRAANDVCIPTAA